ncbi:hypothetical protein Tco_0705656 [Tanacetum coccineum]|uniref:Uncharacterized protein n=1 Tax=Tanacetum coccineum TaxID=301880 RepID=A0ABQ4Y635_9ASTR
MDSAVRGVVLSLDPWIGYSSKQVPTFVSERSCLDCLTRSSNCGLLWVELCFVAGCTACPFLEGFSLYSQASFQILGINTRIVEWLSRNRTSMDVVLLCQVVDYHLGENRPTERRERSYFLLWVLSIWLCDLLCVRKLSGSLE